MFVAFVLSAQENESSNGPRKGGINVEFTAGINNTTPVGIDAKAVRNALSNRKDLFNGYSGSLLPKTAAYVGFLIDYQFHEVGALGFGLIYTPKGLWLFEKNVPEGGFLSSIDKRKTFVTVDYFDIPIFFKEYFRNQKLSLRFGPVISMALLSKVRITSEDDGEKTMEKYRLGEGTNDEIFYEGLVNETPKFIVPGFEAALNFGNTAGWQGTVVVGFSGSMFENADLKSIIARIGISYTFTK